MSSVLLLISLVASNIGPSLESGDLGDGFSFDLKKKYYIEFLIMFMSSKCGYLLLLSLLTLTRTS